MATTGVTVEVSTVRLGRVGRIGRLAALAAGVPAAVLIAAPAAGAWDCAPGFERNPYNAQCLAPVTTPSISGVPCVASKIGLCRALSSAPPPRVPGSSFG